jgi:hypothetical protein
MKKIMKSVALAATAIATMGLPVTQAMAAGHNAFVGQYSAADNHAGTIVWGGYANNAGQIPDDTTTAGNKTEQFTMTGSVAKDCSFYAGDDGATTHSINLGAIGVRNGDQETSSTLYNQAAAFNYDIGTSTAGCNYNNTVTVSKNANGLTNTAANGYDSTQFQANIPYSILVGLTATTNQSGPAAGTYTPMTVAADQASNSETLGAWRSGMHVNATIPVPAKALVAGTYSDTITVTLATS